jgi:site-specific DNA-methyltransferase (adenine-specific)
MNDNLSKEDYLKWCEVWLNGCINVLKDGGSLFLWNIPKWNTYLSDYLNRRLTFKHWIAVDVKYSLPISGKLYPSHYSLLYYVKGEKANTFHPDRLPMEVCKSCFREIKDYGGYKDKMNPKGINIADVWYDIPPVRHSKYKTRDANELSIRLLDRIIEMASNPGDVVFDPFGGSGTTYIVSELKRRKWIGVELGSTSGIIERFKNIEEEKQFLKNVRKDYNKLFTDSVKAKRKQTNLWTDESFPVSTSRP